jgi:DNA-damage-inducible protein D
MKNQLKTYDYLDVLLYEYQQQQCINTNRLAYFLSDVLTNLNIQDAIEIEIAINRTFAACKVLKISKNLNFRKIYRFDGNNLHIDWEISKLACYLIIINSNPTNKLIAKAQLHFTLNK